jgi:hypothetical protein
MLHADSQDLNVLNIDDTRFVAAIEILRTLTPAPKATNIGVIQKFIICIKPRGCQRSQASFSLETQSTKEPHLGHAMGASDRVGRDIETL